MSDVASEAAALKRWLFDVALPLWWDDGADRVGGGFHEAIGLDGRPLARPHRARVIARQAFSYCEAGRLGWHGPWREAQRYALDYFRKYFITADATVVSVVDLDGKVGDARFDLYNQAFALLAYAGGHCTFGEADGWRRQAVALRTTLEQSYAHPLGGFVEDRAGRLPQRSNPHMHLLEAALAWIAIESDPGWRRMADAIATLCLEKFIDPRGLGRILCRGLVAGAGCRRTYPRAWAPIRVGISAGSLGATHRPKAARSGAAVDRIRRLSRPQSASRRGGQRRASRRRDRKSVVVGK